MEDTPSLDDVFREYQDRIDSRYREEFARTYDAVEEEREENGLTDGKIAGFRMVASLLAWEDRSAADIGEEHGISHATVSGWANRLVEQAGYSDAVDFQGGMLIKTFEEARERTRNYAKEHRVGVKTAAERVGEDYPFSHHTIANHTAASDASKFSPTGITEQLYRAVKDRPRTTTELVEEFSLDYPPAKYIGKGRKSAVSNVKAGRGGRNPSGGQEVVWYTGDDRDEAELVRDLVLDPRETLQQAVEDDSVSHPLLWHLVERNLFSEVAGTVEAWMEDKLSEFHVEDPTSFGRFKKPYLKVSDHLSPDLTEKTYADVDDIQTALPRANPPRSALSFTLKCAEDRLNAIEGFGGKPRKYDTRTYLEPVGDIAADVLRSI